MRKQSFLFIIIFFGFCLVTFSQAENRFDSLWKQADSLYKEKNYQKALQLNLEAVKMFRDNNNNSYLVSLSPVVFLNTGKCYKELNDFAKAHSFMANSLRMARAIKIPADIEAAFIELNNLHRYIAVNNLEFNYPEVPVTEETIMFFPVTKVEKISKDSIRLTIQAGKYDGITDSLKRGGVISRFEKDKKERPFGLVNCYIKELTNNYCIATARNDSLLYVKPGDVVELKTRVPLFWRKLDVSQSMLRAITFNDNYKQPVFHHRYLYYFADSLTNNEIALILKKQVDDIVELLAEDTAKGDFVDVKGEKGIFAGDNIMRAMSNSKSEHLKLFLSFVNAFPRTYIGSSYKFSEVYATWVINNTPLAVPDVMPLLVNIRNRKARQQMVFNLSASITEAELIDKWFNDGMLMANSDNIDSAFYLAELIKDATISLKDKSREGWADYLLGYTEKKLGNSLKADSAFQNAYYLFQQAANKEGETWATNAIENLNSSRQVSINVQTGHVFQYIMAPSPNSKFLATAGTYDRTVKIWDMSLNRAVASFVAHQDEINSVQYSPNGRYLVTASEDHTIKIWNAYDFSLLNTIVRPKPEVKVIFTPDSKQLVAGGRDSLIKFLDINDGSVKKTFKKHRSTVTSLCFMPSDADYLFSGGSDSVVYKWNVPKNDWDHWYGAKGRVIDVKVSNDGKYLSFVGSDTLIRVWKLQNDKFYYSVRPNYSVSNAVDISLPSFTPDSRYQALSLRDDTLIIVDLTTLRTQQFGFKNQGKQGMYDMVFSTDGSYLSTRMSLGGPLRVFNFSGWDFNTNPVINTKEIKNFANIPLAVQFTRDDNELVVIHEAISKFDLRNGKTSFLFYGANIFMNNYILLNDGITGLFSDFYSAKLNFYDFVNKKTSLVISLPDEMEEIFRFELSGDNRYIFLSGKNNTVAGFSLPEGKMLFASRYNDEGEKNNIFLRYDSIRQQLYIVGKNSKIIVADALTGKIKGVIKADRPQSVEVTPQYLYITCNKSMVNKYDVATLKLKKEITVHKSGIDAYGSVMSWDYKYLVVQVADVFVTLDTHTEKVLYEKYDHDYQNGTMSISYNNKMLATGGFDSKINLYDLPTGKKMSSIYTPKEKDFMTVDSAGNYMAPKNSLEAVTFTYNSGTYGFEQFDVQFNRPDIVLKNMGRADTALITTFYNAWKKRLKKLEINQNEIGSDVHLPVVRLKDKYAIKAGTSLDEYELTINCFDSKYPLKSLQVIVNNNSVFGSAGKAIGGSEKSVSVTVKVPLSNGNNKLKIYCTNSKGAMSLSEYMEINSSYSLKEKPKTYFIGIAVSGYKDSSMNLQYAAKDVRDLAASFGKLFKNCEVDTLIDQYATKENIIALRNKLMKTTVNDKVIISVNGHGLLSDSLDFYFATYDVDFNKPELRGLKYEEMEALLDGIPARKKLMLIDACHSGALDKEEILSRQKDQQIVVKDTTTDKGIITGVASRGIILDKQQSVIDANSSYEVMQNLFADLSSSNGAVIISAAGGMEYAFESDKWNNGVFTYCIRKGIEEELADKEDGNLDKLVSVSELKNYVSRKVSELTGGKQRPVSRKENIEFDWVVW